MLYVLLNVLKVVYKGKGISMSMLICNDKESRVI